MDTELEAAAALGPYFVWDAFDGSPDWRPLTDLLDDRVVAERVEAGRQTLMRMSGLGRDAIEERVVASITFLGLVSRLVSPPVGAAALTGALPRPTMDQLWWRPVAGGPLPIAYGKLELGPAQGATLVSAVIRDVVEPILEVHRRRFRLSPQVLWGNVASALGGATGMIARGAGPAVAERAATLVTDALGRPPLLGTATVTRPFSLRRTNCCLYYRIPGGGTCGDCVLTAR